MGNTLSEINYPYEIVNKDTDNGKRLYGILLYADTDDVRFKLDRMKCSLKKGGIAYVRPMTDISDLNGGYTLLRLDIHTLEIPDAYVSRVYAQLGESITAPSMRIIGESAVNGIISAINELSAEKNSFSMKAYALILHIAELLTVAENARSVKDITTISQYIDIHSSQNPEVTALAEMCRMSYPTFARRFHDIYGRSCKEHIAHVRAVRARRLLMTTDLDIAEIAEETGFFDSSHLIRTYKKLIGTTPSHERS